MPSLAETSGSAANWRSTRSTGKAASSAVGSSCWSEDSTSTDTGTAVQKAHKLIDHDKVNFILGNVNSAMALAIGDVTAEAGVLHIVTGGHTDAVTGSDCHWNVFRVCNTTRMETNAVSKLLFDKFGKKWYFITPDYAFGHTLQQGFEASLKKFGGTEVGASLVPLGATDFSSYLIKAQAAKPDVILFLPPAKMRSIRSSRRCSSDWKRSFISPAHSRSSRFSKACRRTPASGPGCSSGTGTSRTCHM